MTETVTDDEASFVKALRAGDSVAFERLVRRYGGRLLAVSKRLLSNHDDALEAVQDGFLSAFRSLESFDERCQFSTWLHRIVVNASLMKLRSKRRRPEQSIDDLLPVFLADGHQVSPGAGWRSPGHSAAEQNEIQALIRTKIDTLPESYRIVLVLRDIEEMETETVAQLLDITPGAVKVRLHRARQALRTLLDPVFGKSSKWTCREALEFLADYLDGTLPLGQRLSLDLHLTLCSHCRDYLDGYRKTIQVSRDALSDPALCEDLPEDLIQAILATRKKPESGE